MTTIRKLVLTELKMLIREPLVLAFVFAFPVVTVLVLGGVFGANDPAFEGIEPAQWYVAGYAAVVIAAIGLVMLPVHLASYRERGVLRRFAAAGFPRWSFAAAELVVGLVVTFAACAVLLATAGAVYGVPAVEEPVRAVAGLVAGAVAFVSIGLLLGSVAKTARAAQGIGLLAFFPVFLLGGGGPPPHAMTAVMRDISTVIPLTHVTRAIQQPWLGLGTGSANLAIVAAIAVVAALGWVRTVRL
ncbi:MAG TPA: ABC transporter permease [Acidimicrobiales bacterium]|nr:ABC transporter permease [Acidimicrobiales bacterium]